MDWEAELLQFLTGFLDLILQFKVTESRFDQDSVGSEAEEDEVVEGSPQSNAMTEGEYLPDSPISSPAELKRELPKYLPALQVRRTSHW